MADFFVLPMTWGHYQWHGRMAQARAASRDAARFGKPLLVWHSGDLEPVLPFDNAILFENGPKRSERSPKTFAGPAFISDPLPQYAGGRLSIRPRQSTPSIGFCGLALSDPLKLMYSVAANARKQIEFWCGFSAFKPAPLVPASVLRARAVARLADSPVVDAHFVVRDSYRAGRRQAGADDPTVLEFFQNVIDTDYTLCVRGVGNWSHRFYEVLACGRIPIVIDTDLMLPYDFALDWTKYCVWVPLADVSRIGEIVADFHSGLNADEFASIQFECRRVWESRLSLDGFLNHFSEHFDGWLEERAEVEQRVGALQ